MDAVKPINPCLEAVSVPMQGHNIYISLTNHPAESAWPFADEEVAWTGPGELASRGISTSPWNDFFFGLGKKQSVEFATLGLERSSSIFCTFCRIWPSQENSASCDYIPDS